MNEPGPTNTKKTIRRAEPSDTLYIEDCVRAAYAKYLPRMNKPPGPMLAAWKALLAEHQVWVVDDDEEGCAAVLVLILGEGHLLLDNIAVHPLRQGHGLGSMLLTFAETEAIRQGYGEIRLYTNECMAESVTLYARRGYEETGRMIQQGYSRIFMRKHLERAAACLQTRTNCNFR